MLVLCVRERTFLVTEQLAVDGPFGNSTAVHSKVRPVLARRIRVYDLRKMLFTHTRLAGNEYAQIRTGHLYGDFYISVEQRAHTNNPKPLLDT